MLHPYDFKEKEETKGSFFVASYFTKNLLNSLDVLERNIIVLVI